LPAVARELQEEHRAKSKKSKKRKRSGHNGDAALNEQASDALAQASEPTKRLKTDKEIEAELDAYAWEAYFADIAQV
jgi:hypothetical protein